jgi:NitT/TauT family transport system ATP-binding protein
MVTHDIKEAFSLGTRVLTLDKRRHDPHAPHRYGAAVVYDLALRKADSQSSITIDANHNNGHD